MFTKSTIALAVIVGITSGALDADKPHYGAAYAYGHSPSIDNLCRQKGPIALPPVHPIWPEQWWTW